MEKGTKVYKARILAEQNLYKSVISINKASEEEAKNKEKDFLTFGVKNTVDIPKSLVDKLRKDSKYLLLTVDKMSHLGRSIDTDLINPLTYRCMTGSSSGTAINILKGINDFGIGTDGGGSVLAPALSTNLYSFIGSGVGLVTGKESLSTDSISFTGGIGIISKNFPTLKNVVFDILDKEIQNDKIRNKECNENDSDVLNKRKNINDTKLRIAIPKHNSIILPDDIDMRVEIDKVISNLNKHKVFEEKQLKNQLDSKNSNVPEEKGIKLEFIEYSFDNIYERNIAIKEIKNIFDNDVADIILTYEGPIDIYGYDETIQRSFKGKAEKKITSNGGKGIVKAINMCKCTGITIPGEKLASGFVICAKEGIQGLINAFTLGQAIDECIEKNEMFNRYFIDREKFIDSINLD
jgi:Amidase